MADIMRTLLSEVAAVVLVAFFVVMPLAIESYEQRKHRARYLQQQVVSRPGMKVCPKTLAIASAGRTGHEIVETLHVVYFVPADTICPEEGEHETYFRT